MAGLINMLLGGAQPQQSSADALTGLIGALSAPPSSAAVQPNPYGYLPPDDWVGRLFRSLQPGYGNYPMPDAQVPDPTATARGGREFNNQTWVDPYPLKSA